MTMTSTDARPETGTARAVPAALVTAGIALALYPIIRPASDERTLDGAAAFGSSAWLLAHLLAVAGFCLITTAFVLDAVRAPASAHTVRTAAAIGAATGTALLTLYYGFEAFALYEIGRSALDAGSDAIMPLAEDIRQNPVALTVFGIGWIVFGASITAWVVSRFRRGPQSAFLVLFAASVWFYLPQFYLPYGGRVAHGVVVLIALAGSAWAVATEDAEDAGASR